MKRGFYSGSSSCIHLNFVLTLFIKDSGRVAWCKGIKRHTVINNCLLHRTLCTYQCQAPLPPIGVRVGVGWGFDTQEVQSLRPLGQNYRKIPLFIKFHGSCVLTLPCTIINGVLMYMCNNCTLSMIKCPSHPLLGQIPHPLGRNMRQRL